MDGSARRTFPTKAVANAGLDYRTGVFVSAQVSAW